MSWLQMYEKALGMEVGTLERSGRDSEVIYDRMCWDGILGDRLPTGSLIMIPTAAAVLRDDKMAFRAWCTS